MADKGLTGLTHEIIKEVVSVAQKRGIRLAEDIAFRSLEKARNFPAETKTSYQRDIEERTRHNEGDIFGGAVIRMGHAAGIPTPATASIYEQIQQNVGAAVTKRID